MKLNGLEEKNMKAMVVIPTYNEKENIVKVVKMLLKLNSNIEILIVDDNSPDGTGKVVDDLAKIHPEVQVIHRKRKLGLGTAYVTGFKYALSHKADYIFSMDADLSHDPRSIPLFLEKAKDYDLVVGSRYINGVRVLNWPLRRLFLSVLANFYVRTITGMSLKDCTSGYCCYRRRVLEEIGLEKITSEGYSFLVELKYRAKRKGFKIIEVPIVFNERCCGRSKMSAKVIAESLLTPWRLRVGFPKL